MTDLKQTEQMHTARKYAFMNAALQCLSFGAELIMMYGISVFLSALYQGVYHLSFLTLFLMTASGTLIACFLCHRGSRHLRYRAEEFLMKEPAEETESLKAYAGIWLPKLYYAVMGTLLASVVLSLTDFTAGMVLAGFALIIPAYILFRHKACPGWLFDLVRCIGTAAGMIIVIAHFRTGSLTLSAVLFGVLLSAEFWQPLRSFVLCRMPETVSAEEKEEDADSFMQKMVRMQEHTGLTAVPDMKPEGKAALSLCRRKDERATYIPSHPYFFSGSVRENLLAADPEADEALLHDALYLSGLNSVTDEELLSYDVKGLTEGQLQQLGVSRSLLGRTDVMIFDDVTSCMDDKGRQQVLDTLCLLSADRSVFLLSADPACVKRADHVYLSETGEILDIAAYETMQNGKEGEEHEAF